MAIDMYKTRTMLAAIEQMKPSPKFLDGLVFTRRPPSMTEYIDVDIERGGDRMAPFVHHTVQGRVVQRNGFDTKSYKPPYIKMKMLTTADDILERQAGSHVYQGGMSPSQRAAQQLGKDTADLISRIDRRIEYMCSTALDTGTVTVAGDGIEMLFDFGMPATHKLGVADISASWDDGGTASDPVADLRDLANLIWQDSGVWPNVCVMSHEAMSAFLTHPDVSGNHALMSSVQVNLGSLEPEMMDNGVTRMGFLKSLNLNLYGYNQRFTDPDTDASVRLMPAKKIWLGNTRVRNSVHFGAIRDLSVTNSVQYYPKTWVENDPSARILLIQSAPMVALHQPDCWASVQVIT